MKNSPSLIYQGARRQPMSRITTDDIAQLLWDHQRWHQNGWFIVPWSLVSKLPSSELKYCCCNKTGKAKRTSKTFSCSKKINKKQLWIRDSYTFWVSNIFDSIQEVRKPWHTLGSFSFAATCKASLKRWFSTCGLLSSWSQAVFQKQNFNCPCIYTKT